MKACKPHCERLDSSGVCPKCGSVWKDGEWKGMNMTKPKRTRTMSPAALDGLAKARAAKLAAREAALRVAGPGPGHSRSFLDQVKAMSAAITVTDNPERVFAIAGDIGDCIAMLPSIRHMGGGHIVITPPPPGVGTGQGFCRESMEGARYESIRPLLECQPYIRSVSWGPLPAGAIDVSHFRTPPHFQENIIQCIARYLKLGRVSEEPWLTVPFEGEAGRGPVVFSRSPRYHQPRMNWQGYVSGIQDSIFIGSPDEHAAFEKYIGRTVKHQKTKDLLEVAKLMMAARFCAANQSCPLWIAMGLGRPFVLEVCPDVSIQNSIVVRENGRWVGNEDQVGVKKNWF